LKFLDCSNLLAQNTSIPPLSVLELAKGTALPLQTLSSRAFVQRMWYVIPTGFGTYKGEQALER
jgi:hypothetical protein